MRLFHTFRLRTTFKANFVDNSVDKLSDRFVYREYNSANSLFLFIRILILFRYKKRSFLIDLGSFYILLSILYMDNFPDLLILRRLIHIASRFIPIICG